MRNVTILLMCALAAVPAVQLRAAPGQAVGLPVQSDRAVVEQTIRDSIGWALTKDRARLEQIISHEPELFIVNPDSPPIAGWPAFEKNFAFWMDPRFKATSFDVRDLRVTFARGGAVAWFSATLDDLAEWEGRPVGWKDTRWTGVVEKREGRWVIAQMHFSFAADRGRPYTTGGGLSGPYLGQRVPGTTPEVFAPGVVSTGGAERDIAITPDGGEIYFGVAGPGFQYSTVMVSRLVDGRWTEPAVVPGLDDPRYLNLEPALSPDGNTLYFLSNRPDEAAGTPAGNQDIWYLTRTATGWSTPRNLGAPVNTVAPEYFPSVTRDGTIYFTREDQPGSRASTIWRARRQGSGYATPERLPTQVNAGTSHYNAFVAPDESYLIVPIDGRADSIGGCDYYVVFRNPDDRWSEPINLGPAINTRGSQEHSPYVSPDGRFFFFMSSRITRPERLTSRWLREAQAQPGSGSSDIYWVDAIVVTALRAKAVFGP